jgi:hypothetical protein
MICKRLYNFFFSSKKKSMSDFPPTVYKYRDWNNDFHKSILTKNQIYLASPKDFNDPFDCRITTNYSLLKDADIPAYVQKEVLPQLAYMKRMRMNVDEQMKSFETRLRDREKFQKESDTIELDGLDDHTGVLALSARWNSILMWGHYGNCHTGFCVGFNEEFLRNSALFGKGGMVHYSNSYPELKPNPVKTQEWAMEVSFKKTHSKAKDWSYEEEYRLSSTKYPERFSNEDRIITLPDNYYAEIILGLKISEDHKKEIMKIGAEKKLPIYQISQIPFEFKMDRIKLL